MGPRALPVLHIRAARPGDLDAIDAIEAASFTVDRFSRRTLARLLKSATAAAAVAETKSGVAGYVLLLFRKGAKRARLYSLATAPDARGLGAGRALVDAAVSMALDRGCGGVRLEVRESNLAAQKLYRSAGFNLIARKPNYYEDGEAAFQMEKRLELRKRATQ